MIVAVLLNFYGIISWNSRILDYNSRISSVSGTMKIRLGKAAVNIFKAFQSNTRFFVHFYYSQIIRGFSRNIFCFLIHFQNFFRFMMSRL